MNLCQVFSCCFKPSMVSERTSRTSDDSDSLTSSQETPEFQKTSDLCDEKPLQKTQSEPSDICASKYL